MAGANPAQRSAPFSKIRGTTSENVSNHLTGIVINLQVKLARHSVTGLRQCLPLSAFVCLGFQIYTE